MTKLPPDDEKLQEFLQRHRPVPPTVSPDLEEKLMKAIALSPFDNPIQQNKAIAKPQKLPKLWVLPSAIVAGLLIAWSSSRLLISSPELSNASLETFLESNWNDVTASPSHNIQTDWMLEASNIH